MREQRVRSCVTANTKHQVEEQLDHADPAAVVLAAADAA
jgi:hypothetical protein